MSIQLKVLNEQVIVLTGATSGIGLVTARMAAQQGARLVLAARNSDALRQLAEEINRHGGQSHAVPTDVANWGQVEHLAEQAIRRFGRIDTWINDAGVSIYGRIDQVPLRDQRRLFETNFWGVVHGCMAALPVLRKNGGALINIGSIVSDRAIPLQGIYSASKHAVQGFTDALRMEVEKDGWPISVTLVKPSTTDTPYLKHARNYLQKEPKFPPPVYSPEIVAETILHCATHPERDVTVGAGGKAMTWLGKLAPRLVDRIMEARMFDWQHSEEPAHPRADNLFEAGPDLDERGGHPGHVLESSISTKAALHPLLTFALAVGAGVLLAGLAASRQESVESSH
ncbi:MAG TPA: SDR family oxidoreductase [Gemmataceae bacterium]|nr:SDR family oxidoreductase [Gemmataceae bacterium]